MVVKYFNIKWLQFNFTTYFVSSVLQISMWSAINWYKKYIHNLLHFYVAIWFSVEFIHLWIQYCPVVSWLSPQRIQFSSNALLHGCNSKYTKLVSSHKLDFVSKVHVHNKTAALFIFVFYTFLQVIGVCNDSLFLLSRIYQHWT